MLGRKVTTNTILLRFYDASLKACMYWCSRYHVKIFNIYVYIYIHMWQTRARTVKHQISSAGTKSTSFYFIGIQLGRFLIWTPCPLLTVNQPRPDVCVALDGSEILVRSHTSRSQHPRCCFFCWCLLAWSYQFPASKCSSMIGLMNIG